MGNLQALKAQSIYDVWTEHENMAVISIEKIGIVCLSLSSVCVASKQKAVWYLSCGGCCQFSDYIEGKDIAEAEINAMQWMKDYFKIIIKNLNDIERK